MEQNQSQNNIDTPQIQAPSVEHLTLKNYLQRQIDLTDEEAIQFAIKFTVKKIKKRQLLVQPDYIAKYRSFVVKGALRSYIIDEEGNEHTITFAIEDWWITDFNSYIFQQPATMFVQALEDCTLLQLGYDQEQELKKSLHKYESFFRQMSERSTAFFQRRLIANLILSAEQRYDNYLKMYPQIAKRVPQYALASFLGMSTEFLSKIRNKKTRKKLN